MSETTGIAVMGASGRMGRMLIQAIEENEHAHLAGVTERPGHDWIGRDLVNVWVERPMECLCRTTRLRCWPIPMPW